MDSIRLISTADGSHSLLNTVLQETYHSVNGALQESNHVFIDHGLDYYLQRKPNKEVRVLEVGFGTGLNSILSLLYAKRVGCALYYESWESEPLSTEIVQQLNYGKILGVEETFAGIHAATWNESVTVHPLFMLHKKHGDIVRDVLSSSFDLIYYDAFAPTKQPELWTKEVLKKVTDTLSPGGVLVTYCAKGQVKRDIASLGLIVETLKGPPGKKEMTRAIRPIKRG